MSDSGPFRRHIVIGDVHGCISELRALLDLCEVTHNDCVVYVGDLLDKGPHGPEVVQLVRKMDEAGQPTIVVLGNHEETNLRFFAFQDQVVSGEITKNPVRDNQGYYLENYRGMSHLDRGYLSGKPVLTYQIPGTLFRVVHAGVTPTYKMPLGPDLSWRTLAKDKKVRGQASIPLRVRFIREHDEMILTTTTQTLIRGGEVEVLGSPRVVKKIRPGGKMISLGEEHPSHPYWAHVYKGRFGHIFFGHNAWKENKLPKEFPHATGLDLGCVFGGHLAAAIISAEGEVEYRVVEAQDVYCSRYSPTNLENGYFRPASPAR